MFPKSEVLEPGQPVRRSKLTYMVNDIKPKSRVYCDWVRRYGLIDSTTVANILPFFRRQSDASRDSSSNNLSSSPSHELNDLLPRPYTDIPSSRDRSSSSTTESRFPAYSSAPRSDRSRSQNKHVQLSIPPPITASVLLPAINLTSSSVESTQTLTPRLSGRNIAPLMRRERALQAEIQELLDAQSAALLRGRAPKPRNVSGGGTSKPPSKQATTPRTLHTARLGILRALHSLLELSQTKHSILLSTHTTLQATLTQLTHWQRKLADLDSKIHALSPPPSISAPDATSPHRRNQPSPHNDRSPLPNDLPTLDREISTLEARLHTLRTHRRLLSRALLEQRSRHEAQASSWVGAKREVESEVSAWLRRPTEALGLDGEVAGEGGEMEAFLSLPPGRRTLGGAIDAIRSVISSVRAQMESVEREGDAVERGAGVWEGVLERVLMFEKELRGWVKRGGGGAEEVLERMGVVGGEIEGFAEVVEGEGWTLLVCAVGAELEAWREGEGVLRGVVGGGEVGVERGLSTSPPQGLGKGKEDVKGKGKRVDNFNSSMGSEGTDIWGSALDTPNPAPDNNLNSTSDSDTHPPDDLTTSQHPHRSLSPTPSPSPTYPRPRSTSPEGDADPDFNIELEGLKLSGGTPTTRSPAFGGAGSQGGSGFLSRSKRERGFTDGAGDREGEEGEEDEDEDEGPGEDLLTELPVEGGYRDEEEDDEGPGDDLLVSPPEK
ncbi:hypothetical protein VE00_06937 [Pseudogymnoascus sp. WSF 3629]|nr:hypothetical protein VE00_06937 [Pseudogymnoascus sp. WSF 3629]